DVAADGWVGDGDVEHHSGDTGRGNPTLAGDLDIDALRGPNRRAEATIAGAGVEDAAGSECAEFSGAAAGIAGVVPDDVIDHVDGTGIGQGGQLSPVAHRDLEQVGDGLAGREVQHRGRGRHLSRRVDIEVAGRRGG